MSESKPVQKTPAWLLVADRYMAEIAEAERLEALAAAESARRTGQPRCTTLGVPRSSHSGNTGPTLIAQTRSRARTRNLTSPPDLH